MPTGPRIHVEITAGLTPEMKAIVQRGTGTPDVLALEDVETPEMRPADVLIRVAACGVCYHDVVVRDGAYRKGVNLPLIPGHEVSGIVERVGPAVRNLRVGQRVCTTQRRYVCGRCRECRSERETACPSREFMGDAHLNGGYAELVAVDESCVALVPAGIEVETAAIVACAVGVALNAVRDVGRVRLGETVLVTGASGGQGSHGIQVARASGAEVLAVTSHVSKVAQLEALGAHRVLVVPHGQDFSRAVREATDGRGVDVVIDNVGTAIYESVRRSFTRGGRWVMVGALNEDKVGFNPAQMFTQELSLLSVSSCTRAHLEDALRLVQRGVVRPLVSRRLPLAEAAAAHRDMETAAASGRILLLPGAAAFENYKEHA